MLSKLGWIARIEAPAKSLVGHLAAPGRESLGWTSTRHSEAVQRPGATSKTLWTTESVPPKRSLAGRQAARVEAGPASADGVVAVGCSKPLGSGGGARSMLSGSRLAPEVTGWSELDGFARMEAPAKISAWPPAKQG